MAVPEEDFKDLKSDLQKAQESFRCSVYVGSGDEGAEVRYGGLTPTPELQATRINDAVHELYRPGPEAGSINLEVVFFHGLRLGNYHNNRTAHIDTWMSSSDPSECWIKAWLPRCFPRARVLTASYDSSGITSTYSSCDLYLIAESVAYNLLVGAKVGQQFGTPVILVGHCIGGLVIKSLCLHIGQNVSRVNREARESFVENMMGAFFFATPQCGMKLKHLNDPGPLAECVEVLGKSTARLNQAFEDLRKLYHWVLCGVGESQPTRLRDLQRLFEEDVLMVEEGSCRPYLDEFMCIPGADHFNICRPKDMLSSTFRRLVKFLEEILMTAKDKNPIPCPQQVPKESVGLEKRLTELKKILLERDNVQLEVNICGMGGIGKTTLAKALFNELCVNELFDYTTFTESSSYDDYFSLQTVIKHHLYYKGMKISGTNHPVNLSGKKVLFILDDVRDGCSVNEPIDVWFKEVAKSERDESRIDVRGSCLIVTSREKDVLRNSNFAYTFDMTLLDEQESFELLVKHAFPNERSVPGKFSEGLVRTVAQRCDGLPLTLEVIGKFLSGRKDREEWILCLEKLEAAGLSDDPIDVRLWKTLKVSYDGLNEHLKQMFIDAATIFNGLPLHLAQSSWGTTFNMMASKVLWKHLIHKSLVYGPVGEADSGIIRMHEQLRSLGRFIAGSEEQRSRRRIWKSEDAWKVLSARSDDDYDSNSDETLKSIHALRFHFSEVDHHTRRDLPVNIRHEQSTSTPSVSPNGEVVRISSRPFCKMTNLRYLLLDGVDIIGSDKKKPFSSNLVMLIWYSGGTSSELPIRSIPGGTNQLTVLHLLSVHLDNIDPLTMNRFPNLKVVELRSAKKMEQLSDNIVSFKNLEQLSLYWCPHLVKIPRSVGNWESLVDLVFWDCPKLHTLPELGTLSNLKRLILYRCSSLKHLPKTIGSLISLRVLDLHRCSNLEELPHSIGNLSTLQSLNISGKFVELPCSFGEHFLALRTLKFKYCENLRSLPANTFKSCSNLERLTFLCCEKLEALPGVDVFEGLRNLKNVLVGWVAVDREQIEELQMFWTRQNIPYNVRGTIGPGLASYGWPEADIDAISVDDDHSLQEKDTDGAMATTVNNGNCKHECSRSKLVTSSSKTCTHRFVKGENLQQTYLALESVHESLKRIIVEVESHDQGYSSFFWAHGTELCAHSYCELSVRTRHSPEGEELARVVLFFNLHAVEEWQTHRYNVEDKELLALIKPGYIVEVTLRSQWLAWETYAKSGSLELIPADDHRPADSLDLVGIKIEYSTDRTTRPLIRSYSCQNMPRRIRDLKGEYVRIVCWWPRLEKIYVEFDSLLLIPEGNEVCYNNKWGPIWSDDRRSSWSCSPHYADIGVIGKDGSEVGPRLRVSTSMYGGFGWQRHTYLVEDESFLNRISEGCSVVLWITADFNYPNTVCWNIHFQIRRARIHLIPELDNLLPQHINPIFPGGLSKVETFQKLRRGRCLNWMYLAYQVPFAGLRQIDVVVEANECALGPKNSVHPELVLLVRKRLSTMSSEELQLMIKVVKAQEADLVEILEKLSPSRDTWSTESDRDNSPRVETSESHGDGGQMLMEVSRSAESDGLPQSKVQEINTTDEEGGQTSESQSSEDHCSSTDDQSPVDHAFKRLQTLINRAQSPGERLTWENLCRWIGTEGGGQENLILSTCHAYISAIISLVQTLGQWLTWDELSLLIDMQLGNPVAERLEFPKGTGKGSTWGEIGLLTAEGDLVGERIVVFTNPHYNRSTSPKRHSFTISEQHHQTFLNSIRKGYRVVLWLRSGPGWTMEQPRDGPTGSRCENFLDLPCLPGFARTAMRHISQLSRCLPLSQNDNENCDPAVLSAHYASINLVPKL